MPLEGFGWSENHRAILVQNTTVRGALLLLACTILFGAATGLPARAADAPTTGTTSAMAIHPNLPTAYIGAAYSGSVAASGGVAPYHYSVVDGALPKGVVMGSNTGSIAGVPSTVGTFGFRVAAVDSRGWKTAYYGRVYVLYPSSTGPTGIAVTVIPTSSAIALGKTQQFTAKVTGSTSAPVWSVTGKGTVSSAGLYIAPVLATTDTVSACVSNVCSTARITVSGSTPPSPSASLSVSPVSLNFANVTVGTTSPTQIVTVTNTGAVTTTVTRVYSGAGFSTANTGTCSNGITTLVAGASCTYTAHFTASTAGSFAGSMTITTNPTSSPYGVALSATAITTTTPPPPTTPPPTTTPPPPSSGNIWEHVSTPAPA